MNFKRNVLTTALLCGFAAAAGAQTTGSSAGTTAATPSTATSAPTTGTTATITTESGRTATADIPGSTIPNTTSPVAGSAEHTVSNPAPTPATTADATDPALDEATRGNPVSAQAQATRGQGQDTAAAVRAVNPSSQNAQSDTVAAAPNFDTLDLNKDGFVSLNELPVGNTQLSSSFPQYDTDGDSRLTRAELEAVLTASEDTEMTEDSEAE